MTVDICFFQSKVFFEKLRAKYHFSEKNYPLTINNWLLSKKSTFSVPINFILSSEFQYRYKQSADKLASLLKVLCDAVFKIFNGHKEVNKDTLLIFNQPQAWNLNTPNFCNSLAQPRTRWNPFVVYLSCLNVFSTSQAEISTEIWTAYQC